MPAVLNRLARHDDIGTKMGHHVSLGTDGMTAAPWASRGPQSAC